MQLLQGSQREEVKSRQRLVEGIEQFTRTFAMLFAGENHGNLILLEWVIKNGFGRLALAS